MGERVRLRHGVVHDWAFGYRAVAEWNGERSYIGPWTTEEQAQANADEAARVTHEVLDGMGAPRVKGDTPLDIWLPLDGES